VNHFLPDLIFEDISIAYSTKSSRVQNLDLLLQEAGEFSPQIRCFSMVPPFLKQHHLWSVKFSRRRGLSFEHTLWGFRLNTAETVRWRTVLPLAVRYDTCNVSSARKLEPGVPTRGIRRALFHNQGVLFCARHSRTVRTASLLWLLLSRS
jgi:hypothetical protein